MGLEDFKEFIYRCAKCGACRLTKEKGTHGPYTFSCPSGVKFGFESYWPSGKNDIARGLMEGDLEWSGRLMHRIYTCTTCGTCDMLCYEATGKGTLPVIMGLRKELVKRDIGPPAVLKKVRKDIDEHHNPQKMAHDERRKWMTEEVPATGKVMFFVGCTGSYIRQEISGAVVKVLKSAGTEFGVLDDEWCCGYPDYYAGYEDPLEEIARHNVEALEKAGAEKVIFSCPGCYDVFKKRYPAILGKQLPFELQHTTEYFMDLMEKGVLRPNKELGKRITYHDPCKLGRMNGCYDAPRELLARIPGLELVEMERKREFSWCCGGGGNIPFLYPAFERWTARGRLEEAGSTRADMLVSACPGCKNTLLGASKGEGEIALDVVDITELLAESI